MKTDVRRIAEEQLLLTARKKESMGICFVGKRKFKTFIDQYIPAQDGVFIDIEKWREGRARREKTGNYQKTCDQGDHDINKAKSGISKRNKIKYLERSSRMKKYALEEYEVDAVVGEHEGGQC